MKLRYWEVNVFWRIFQRVDTDQSRSVTLLEMLMHLDMERTAFNEFALGDMDIDGSGDVDFVEFTCAYWNFCSLTKKVMTLKM